MQMGPATRNLTLFNAIGERAHAYSQSLQGEGKLIPKSSPPQRREKKMGLSATVFRREGFRREQEHGKEEKVTSQLGKKRE